MIKVCCPTYNRMMLPETAEMLDKIKAFYGDDPHICDGGGSIAQNRNRLLTSSNVKKQFFNFDYLLFVDADIYCKNPIELIESMVASFEPVVSIPYTFRTGEHVGKYFCAGFFEPGRPFIREYVSSNQKGFHPVDFMGLGFCLIERQVFEKIEYPYFQELTIDCGDCASYTSEDIGFFWKVRRAGFLPFLNCGFQVSHKSIGG